MSGAAFRSTTTLSGTAAALGSVNCRHADRAIVILTVGGAETVDVRGNIDAVQSSATGLRPINMETGAVEATDSELASGTYMFDNLGFDSLTFTKSAGVESATVTVMVV